MDQHRNELPNSENSEDLKGGKGKFIVPPALDSMIDEFLAHYKTASGEPIMILGDTGVGKILFLRIARELYREENRSESEHPIVEANCAHFGGQHSDPNVARGELFGVDRSFVPLISRGRAARENVLGLIDRANGGMLILEEIGELPLEVQSMLLTFIETGEYRRVGGTETCRARVRIVGATNREEGLRPDFRYRFYPFHVGPVHERRIDILYYLYDKFPDLVGSLTPFEVLSFLAYNWPGNVREIHRVGRSFLRLREYRKLVPSKSEEYRKLFGLESEEEEYDSDRLFTLDPRDTALQGNEFKTLYNDLKDASVDVDYLDKLLIKFGVGLNPNVQKPAFKGFKEEDVLISHDPFYDRFNLKKYQIKSFIAPFVGFGLFCELFFQDSLANKNIAKLIDKDYKGDNFIPSNPFAIPDIPESQRTRFGSLAKSIFEFISGVCLPKRKKLPESQQGLDNLILELRKSNPNNEFLVTVGPHRFSDIQKLKIQTEATDIYSMKYHALRKLNFQEGLRRAHGNISELAIKSGLPRSTVNDYLRKLGIIPGKSPKAKGPVEAN